MTYKHDMNEADLSLNEAMQFEEGFRNLGRQREARHVPPKVPGAGRSFGGPSCTMAVVMLVVAVAVIVVLCYFVFFLIVSLFFLGLVALAIFRRSTGTT